MFKCPNPACNQEAWTQVTDRRHPEMTVRRYYCRCGCRFNTTETQMGKYTMHKPPRRPSEIRAAREASRPAE